MEALAASITSQLPTSYPNVTPPGTALASTNTRITNESLRHQRPITSNARHMRNPLGEVVPITTATRLARTRPTIRTGIHNPEQDQEQSLNWPGVHPFTPHQEDNRLDNCTKYDYHAHGAKSPQMHHAPGTAHLRAWTSCTRQ